MNADVKVYCFQLVMFLPALCRKMGVPYCIVKNKSRLGRVCRRKTTSCLAVTSVRMIDNYRVTMMIKQIRANPMISLIKHRFPDVPQLQYFQWPPPFLLKKNDNDNNVHIILCPG